MMTLKMRFRPRSGARRSAAGAWNSKRQHAGGNVRRSDRDSGELSAVFGALGRLGKVGETVNAIAPGLLQFVMTGAYHVFPETAGKDAADGHRPKPADEEISVEAAAMAYLMKGIHF